MRPEEVPAVVVRAVAVGLSLLRAEEEREKREVGVGAQHDVGPLLVLPCTAASRLLLLLMIAVW